jgi:hypothetical protein
VLTFAALQAERLTSRRLEVRSAKLGMPVGQAG